MATFTLPPVDVNRRTVNENQFSKHDNRHAFQSCGVYFGQGLGKRLQLSTANQHRSENLVSWGGPCNYSSTYATIYRSSDHLPSMGSRGYSSPPCPHSTLRADGTLLQKFDSEKVNFRRFPRKRYFSKQLKSAAVKAPPYLEAGHTHPTPLSVLASTQLPLLKHSPWAYSYKH